MIFLTVTYGPQREKTCLREFANNTGADQPAHTCSLISAFVIRFLESDICILATGEILIFLASLGGLPLGGRTPYITSKNRLRTPKLHIKDVPRTSENSLVRPKMDI